MKDRRTVLKGGRIKAAGHYWHHPTLEALKAGASGPLYVLASPCGPGPSHLTVSALTGGGQICSIPKPLPSE